jgi:hypothetical protein
MNFGTATSIAHQAAQEFFSYVEAWTEDMRKRDQAAAAEDRRRAFVDLCVKAKQSTVRIFRTPAILIKAMPKRVTRQHKTKQTKVLQMRFA